LKIVAGSILGLLIIGCAPSVKRIGYEKPKEIGTVCPIVFIKPNQIGEIDSAFKIGTIKVGDAGFTNECNESDILYIIQNDACSVGGNVAMIKKEKTPDWLSTCYRAEADILKVPDSSRVKLESEYYRKENIEKRADKNDTTQMIIMGLSVVAGLVAGLWMANSIN